MEVGYKNLGRFNIQIASQCLKSYFKETQTKNDNALWVWFIQKDNTEV